MTPFTPSARCSSHGARYASPVRVRRAGDLNSSGWASGSALFPCSARLTTGAARVAPGFSQPLSGRNGNSRFAPSAAHFSKLSGTVAAWGRGRLRGRADEIETFKNPLGLATPLLRAALNPFTQAGAA